MGIKKIRTDKFSEIKRQLGGRLKSSYLPYLEMSPVFLNKWIGPMEEALRNGRRFITIPDALLKDDISRETWQHFIIQNEWVIDPESLSDRKQSIVDYDNEISKFWKLHALGRCAALDIDKQSGNVYCRRHIKGGTFEEGMEAPPAIHSDSFIRVMETVRGNLRYDWWVDCPALEVSVK